MKSLAEKIKLLTENEKRVYTYLSENKGEINGLKIKEICKYTYTSSATVIRTAKKLGYRGYKELIYNLIDKKEPLKCDMSNRFDVKNPERIDRFLEKINSGKICIYAEGLETSVSQYIYQKLLLLGKNVEKFNMLNYDFVESDNLCDVLVIISRDGSEQISLKIAKLLKLLGVEIVVFTSNENSELYRLSDLGIKFIEDLKDGYESYYPNLFFGYTIIFFEKLLKMYFEKKYQILKKITE